MTQVNNWIVGLINRMSEKFPYCGFAYAYESMSEQHVIELTDADTLTTQSFRQLIVNELDHFKAMFADESIVFTDQENDFPLDPPILYATMPMLETSWSNQLDYHPHYDSVSWTPNWLGRTISAYEVLNSVTYGDYIQQQETVTVPTDAIAVGEYNYGMAA